MEKEKKEEVMKEVVENLKNCDESEQKFILGYVEAIKDMNMLKGLEPTQAGGN